MTIKSTTIEGRPEHVAMVYREGEWIHAKIICQQTETRNLIAHAASTSNIAAMSMLLHKELEGFDGLAGDVADYLAAVQKFAN